MKKILFIAFVLYSTTLLNATDYPKDTLWTRLKFPYFIENVMFSKDDKKVYVNTTEGLAILDAQTGKDIEFVSNIDKAGSLKAESIDGAYYINRNMEKYDSKTREMLWKCPTRDSKDFGLLTTAVSENGLYIVISYFKQQNSTNQEATNIDIYNTLTQEKVRSFYAKDAFYKLAISNNSKYFLYCSNREENNKNFDLAFLVDTETSKVLKQLYDKENGTSTGQGDALEVNQISSKNNYAIAKWYDYVTVLDLNTLDSFVYTPTGGGGTLTRVSGISSDEKLLFSGGVKQGSIELYDLQSKRVIYTESKLSKFNGSAYANLSSNNALLTLVSGNGIFQIDLNKTWTGVLSENLNVTLYPNPTNNKLILSNPQNHQINTLTAYDILGRAYPLSANGNEVDVSALAAGKYFLKVGLADGSFLDFGFVKEN